MHRASNYPRPAFGYCCPLKIFDFMTIVDHCITGNVHLQASKHCIVHPCLQAAYSWEAKLILIFHD